RVLVSVGRSDIPGGTLAENCPIMIIAGVFHSDRIKDIFLQDLFIRLHSYLFDYVAQKKITRVAVVELRTGFKLEIAAGVLFDEVVDFERNATNICKAPRLRSVVWKPRRVAQQVMNGHPGA